MQRNISKNKNTCKKIIAFFVILLSVVFYFNGNVKIAHGASITITAPFEGTNLEKGKTTVIMGSVFPNTLVAVSYTLKLYKGSQFINEIGSGIAGGSLGLYHPWAVPTTLNYGNDYKIEAVWNNNNSSSFSPVFSIGNSSDIPPTVDISANPISITPGQSSYILTWSSTRASSCASSEFPTGNAVNNSTGVSTGNLTTSKIYKITCIGPTGNASDQVTVIVYPVYYSSPQVDVSHLYIKTCPEISVPQCQNTIPVTDTTAVLYGVGGPDLTLNPKLQTTAYFRYSKSAIPPIYCNDTYGTNMLSTPDIALGADGEPRLFSQMVSGLTPDTIYYYCAIVSNKKNIGYGGDEIVKQFHTNPLKTRATTSNATHIASTSATLNGSYSSVKTVKTYFKYKEEPKTKINFLSFDSIKEFIAKKIINTALAQTPSFWKIVGEKNHPISNYSNLYGNISFKLTGLKPSTRYTFMAVAESGTGSNFEITNGTTLSFTTSTSSNIGGRGSGEDNETTCTPPNILNKFNVCVNPLEAKCVSPQYILNKFNVCVKLSEATKCISPQYYDLQIRDCVNPISCYPYKFFPPTNSCITQPVCEFQEVLNKPTNTCADQPTSDFCETHLTDPECSYGGGWTWNGSNWVNGIWNGINWVVDNWTGHWNSGTNNGNNNGNNVGIINSTPLSLGQTATPPNLAIVRYHEGIETVFARQIIRDLNFAKLYGYQEGTSLQIFAEDLAHLFAKAFGYIDGNGKEIRISPPDVAAYQLALIGNKLTVYEYYGQEIMNIRNTTTVFKSPFYYEYYFKKN